MIGVDNNVVGALSEIGSAFILGIKKTVIVHPLCQITVGNTITVLWEVFLRTSEKRLIKLVFLF
jgi:hypothetical protein